MSILEHRMNFEQSRIAAEEHEKFKQLVAEKHAAMDRDDMSDDEFIAMTVRAINEASEELDPDHGELKYELDEE
jgi:hypothetical protein